MVPPTGSVSREVVAVADSEQSGRYASTARLSAATISTSASGGSTTSPTNRPPPARHDLLDVVAARAPQPCIEPAVLVDTERP